MSEEQWRPVPGFQEIEASDRGRVRRCLTAKKRPGAIYQPFLRNGYPSVSITSGGRKKLVLVHRMVCMAFHGQPPSPEHETRHLDGRRDNSVPSNLAWGTGKDNHADKVAHGRAFDGESHPRAHFTDAEVSALRQEFQAQLAAQAPRNRHVSGGWLKAAAERTGVPYHTLRKILRGRGYAKAGLSAREAGQ